LIRTRAILSILCAVLWIIGPTGQIWAQDLPPPNDGGTQPPDGGGIKPPDGGGDKPSSGGTNPPPVDGTNPPTGDGTNPPSGDDKQPPPVDGTNPPTGDGTNPPTGDDKQPPPVDGTNPPTGDGTNPPTGDDKQPPPGDGTNLPPGDGRNPPTGGSGGADDGAFRELAFDEWIDGPDAGDLDGDQDVDEEDFKIFLDEVFAGGPVEPGRPGGPGGSDDGGRELVFDEWVDGPEAADLNGDLEIDEDDFKIFLDEVLEGGPSGPGGLPPELIDFLLSLLPEFDDDPELFIPLEDLGLDDRALELLAAEVGDGLTLESIEILLGAGGDPIRGPSDGGGPDLPEEILALLEGLKERFDVEPDLRVPVEEIAVDQQTFFLLRNLVPNGVIDRFVLDGLLGGGSDGPGRPDDRELVFEDWIDGPDSADLNGDLDIDEEDFKIFLDEVFAGGPDGPGGPGGPGGLPPELIDFLLSLQPEFDDDPELFIPLEELGLDGRALELLAAEVGDGLTRETLDFLLSSVGDPQGLPGGGGPVTLALEIDRDADELLPDDLDILHLPTPGDDVGKDEVPEEVREFVADFSEVLGDRLSIGRGSIVVEFFITEDPQVPAFEFAERLRSDIEENPEAYEGLGPVVSLSLIETSHGDQDGPGGPGDFPGGPGLPPELADLLLDIRDEFDDDPEFEFPLEELEVDRETLALLRELVPEGVLRRDIIDRLLGGPNGPEGPGPDPLFAFLEELAEEFEDDPSLLIDVDGLAEELDDPGAIDFILRLAGFDGLLSADEVFEVLKGGPPGGDGDFPRLGRIEGVLEGLDLDDRLIFVNGEAFEPAEDLQIFDRDGRDIDVFTLLEVAGSFPKVEIELNEDDKVVLLRVLSRFEEGGRDSNQGQEFFGPLALIDEGKIIFQGPRFQVTERTHFLDQNNKQSSLADAALGQPVSVTPGPPDRNSDSFDPTATKVQLINPNRPPPASANIIVGNLVAFDGVALELAGPISEWNSETVFVDHEGSDIADPQAIESGSFLRVVTRPPNFGEGQPVAVEVEVLENGELGPPVAEGEPENRPQDEIRIEGFIGEVGDDFIVLEGERLLLDERFLLLDIDGQETGSENIFPGDLLEIDTRPDNRRGFVVTRARVIDPAAQSLGHPGVIIAPFEAIEDGELLLAGQFFAFASDLKIAGRGGRRIEGDELGDVEYVRLTASPPRANRGETLPVVFDIRVANPPGDFQPEEDDRFNEPGARRHVRSSFPEDGDVEIPVFTEVEVSFDGNVSELLFDPEFEFSVFPEPLSFGELEIGTNGRTLSAELQLEDDRSYQLVVISKATGFYSVRFSTGEKIASAAVAGRIVAPEELPRNARFVEGESFAVLIENTFEGEVDNFEDIEDNVVAGIPLGGKDFVFEGVDPGSYLLVAFVGFDIGRGEFVELEAIFDADGDGEPDAIEVGVDERVEVELQLRLPEALEVVVLEPAPRSAAVEIETAIVVEFNQFAFLDPEDILILPPPLEVGDFNQSDDGSAYALEVLLEEDTIYRVIVEHAEDEEGGALLSPVESVFTTAAVFPQLMSISGRLVLPHLPAARRFDGPLLVGIVPASLLEAGEVSFESFSERDIVASTSTTSAEFSIEDVPAGNYLLAAFARVEVPRGFRAPDPRQRSLGDFDIARAGRFSEQTLEVFDTIELFGFFDGDGTKGPLAVAAGATGVEVFLRGELLVVTEVLAREESLLGGDGLPIVSSGDAQIAVRFNKELRSDRGTVAIEAGLNGRALRTFTLDDDGRGVRFDAVFSEEAFHRFTLFKAEAKDGSRLQRPLDIGFSTGGENFSFAQLQGRVVLETRSDSGAVLSGDEADIIDEARVFLFEDEGDELALVGVAEVQDDGSFSMDEVLSGSYQVFAELETASGLELKAIYDSNGDGLADIVLLTGVDIFATAIVSTEADTTTGISFKTVPTGGNVSAVLSLDLDTADGNQSKTTLSNVEVGQQVAVDLYVAGAVDINGYAAKLRYDADILDFVSASDVVEGRTNFLRTQGGLALYLSPLLREPELEFGGAILGATAETAADGDGFLARFVFEVRQEFEGAQVFLESAKLNSITGQDVLEPAIAAKLAPPVFTEQTKGVVSFDFNPAAGDQELFHKGFVSADSVVDVDVYLNLDKIGNEFTDLSNYSVTVEFDAEQMTFISYAAETSEETNVLTAGGGIVPALPAITSANSITFGSAILGPTAATAPDSSGLVGRLTFATTSTFSEVDLLIIN
jgi:hypothetical protein